MSLIVDNSKTSITATASNWPLTGKDSVMLPTFLRRAAISFFGDFTRIMIFYLKDSEIDFIVDRILVLE